MKNLHPINFVILRDPKRSVGESKDLRFVNMPSGRETENPRD
jgi:hypothetical protein